MTTGDMTFLGDGRLMSTSTTRPSARVMDAGCTMHRSGQWTRRRSTGTSSAARRSGGASTAQRSVTWTTGSGPPLLGAVGGDVLVVLLRGRRPPLLFSDYEARPGPWPHTAARRCRSLRCALRTAQPWGDCAIDGRGL